MTDKERINKIMATLGASSVTKFAKSIGRDRPDAIYNVLKKGQKISDLLARDITHHHPQFNYNWIMTGEGEMLNDKNKIIVLKEPDPRDNRIRELTEKLRDRDKIISILEAYNKELLEKNDELRKRLGLI